MNSISWFSDEVNPIPLSRWSTGKVENAEIGDVFVPYEKQGDTALVTLYNMDPVNWNTFMFFYASGKHRTSVSNLDILNDRKDFDTLLSQLVDASGKNIVDNLVQYEIKKSASTGKVTLYVFIYNVVDKNIQDTDKEKLELKIVNNDFMDVEIMKERLSSNVIPALRKILR